MPAGVRHECRLAVRTRRLPRCWRRVGRSSPPPAAHPFRRAPGRPGPGPLRYSATTPVFPTPSVTVKPSVRIRVASSAAVRCSWNASSGCTWRSRYRASRSGRVLARLASDACPCGGCVDHRRARRSGRGPVKRSGGQQPGDDHQTFSRRSGVPPAINRKTGHRAIATCRWANAQSASVRSISSTQIRLSSILAASRYAERGIRLVAGQCPTHPQWRAAAASWSCLPGLQARVFPGNGSTVTQRSSLNAPIGDRMHPAGSGIRYFVEIGFQPLVGSARSTETTFPHSPSDCGFRPPGRRAAPVRRPSG